MHGGAPGHPNLSLLRACGIVGLIGPIGAVVANILGVLIYEEHDWISETISNLAAGPWGWIQDVGLVLLAFGLVAVAAGLWNWGLGGIRRKVVVTALVLLAADVVVIALHNEYGDGDSGKFVIHSYANYALGLLFGVTTWAAARPLGAVGPRWKRFSWGIAIAWVILAPVFYFVPTAWDGLYERGLALLFLGWVAAVSWLLLRRGKGRLGAP